MGYSQNQFEEDIISAGDSDLKLTFIGHGTLMFTFNNKVIHIDPVSGYADYENMPKADLILITHEHGDHLDKKAVTSILKDNTKIILSEICAETITDGIVMKNGDQKTLFDIKIEAVPAYNVVNKRSNGFPFHPKGRGNGYVLTLGNKRVYIAGDTENTPEMKNLKNIDIAFLPMNLPYTMNPEMVADAAKSFRPKILYPYHFGRTDTDELIELLKSEEDIEVRIRKLQ